MVPAPVATAAAAAESAAPPVGAGAVLAAPYEGAGPPDAARANPFSDAGCLMPPPPALLSSSFAPVVSAQVARAAMGLTAPPGGGGSGWLDSSLGATAGAVPHAARRNRGRLPDVTGTWWSRFSRGPLSMHSKVGTL